MGLKELEHLVRGEICTEDGRVRFSRPGLVAFEEPDIGRWPVDGGGKPGKGQGKASKGRGKAVEGRGKAVEGRGGGRSRKGVV